MRQFVLWVLLAGNFAFAQTRLYRVFVLNEGRYDYFQNVQVEPLTLGYIDLHTPKYVVFDTIEGARFGVDMEIDSGYLYVTADSFLLKYDLQTLKPVDTAIARGLRGLAVNGNYIYVARGDLACCNSYIQVYDKRDLSLVAEFDTATTPIKWHCEDIVVVNDTIYAIANNAFVWGQYVGYLIRIPVSDWTQIDTFNLGPDGYNPDNIMVDTASGTIYTVNNMNFTSTSISTYRIQQPDQSPTKVTTINLNLVSGCFGSEFAWDKIYLKPIFSDTGAAGWGDETPSTEVLRYSPQLTTLIDTINVNRIHLYQFRYEPLEGKLWVTETDFVNWGLVLVFDSLLNLVDAFPAGIGAGAIAFEYREVYDTVTALNDAYTTPNLVLLSPADKLRLVLNGNITDYLSKLQVSAYTLAGKLVSSEWWHTSESRLYEKTLPVSGTLLIVVRDLYGNTVYRGIAVIR